MIGIDTGVENGNVDIEVLLDAIYHSGAAIECADPTNPGRNGLR
jgi:hypothetical protein